MGEHDALGAPGGTRRVHQPVDVIRRRRAGGAGASAVRSVSQRPPSHSARAPKRRRVRARPPARPSPASAERDQGGVAHERLGLRVLEDVAHLRRRQPPVDRHRHGTEVVGGEDGLEELAGSCRTAAPTTSPCADPALVQTAGKSDGVCGQLPVRRRLALEDGRAPCPGCGSRGARGRRTSSDPPASQASPLTCENVPTSQSRSDSPPE